MLVPPPPQIALVALKTWAKARGLYGHVLGYPGGVAWAIVVATVAQVRSNDEYLKAGATVLSMLAIPRRPSPGARRWRSSEPCSSP